MPVLVTLAEQKTYLGDAPASADDALLTALIDDVEALFASETGRLITSYQAAGTARTEILDATGSAELYLDYPITALTSVKLGNDPAAPDETLTVADKNVLVYAAGSRRIVRTDGGKFGTRAGLPRYVQVVYDFAADLAPNAKIAIKRAVALIYRQRGSEDVATESASGFYSREMAHLVDDPIWRMAVMSNRRSVLV